MSNRLKALIFVSASLLVWSGWCVGRPGSHAYRDLSRGKFSDHFSHMNAARAFAVVGTEVWRRPFSALFRSMTPEELAALPDDVRTAAGPEVRFVPGWPEGKPLVVSWSHNPRLYPPGDMLLVAPVALAYHFTPLSFSGANTLLILLFLVYAHVGLYFVMLAALEGSSAFPFLAVFIIYCEVIHWTLEGFYDAAVIAPLVLCALYLRDRRGLAAILAFCVAVAIHFRALFFVPWVVSGVALELSVRPWRTWTWRDVIAASVAAGLAVVTLYVLYLIWPTLRSLPVNSPVSFALPSSTGPLVTLAVVALAVAAVLAWTRAWLDLALTGWFVVMLLQLHEAYPWHLVALLPFLLASWTPQVPYVARDARAVFFIAASVIVFRNTTVPFWVARLF